MNACTKTGVFESTSVKDRIKILKFWREVLLLFTQFMFGKELLFLCLSISLKYLFSLSVSCSGCLEDMQTISN